MAAALFRQPRTRNPLLRVFSAMLGVLVVGATLVFGFFVLVALAAIGGAVWAARHFSRAGSSGSQETPQAARTANPPPPGVIEGEFVVVREPAHRR